MRSPVRALIWEQWQQVWWTAPLTILFTLGVSIGLGNYRDIDFHKDIWMVGNTSAILVSLLLAGGLLLFVHSPPNNFCPGLPMRHRTLPVGTMTLVLSQYLFRVGFIVLLAATLLGVVTLTNPNFAPYFAPGVVTAACAMSIAMATTWTIGKRHTAWAMALTVGMLLSFGLLLVALDGSIAAMGIPCTLVLLISSFVAVRSGVLEMELEASRLIREGIQRVSRLGHKPIRSALDAQAWFDAQRRKRVVLAFTALTVLPLAAVLWAEFQTALREGTTASLRELAPLVFAKHVFQWSLAWLWIPPIIALASGACFFMLDLRDTSRRGAEYVFTRPISTADIVRTQFRFAIRAAIALALPAVALSVACQLLGVAFRPAEQQNTVYAAASVPEYLLMIILSVAATMVLFWSAVPAVLAIAWFGLLGPLLSGVMGAGGVAGVVPIVFLVAAYVRSAQLRHKNIWGPHVAVRAVVCSVVFVLLAVLLESSNWNHLMYEIDEYLYGAICVAALFLYAVFSQPAWIEGLRHGGINSLTNSGAREA